LQQINDDDDDSSGQTLRLPGIQNNEYTATHSADHSLPLIFQVVYRTNVCAHRDTRQI